MWVDIGRDERNEERDGKIQERGRRRNQEAR